MASGTDMLSREDRIDRELDATLKFYKVVSCIEKWQIASSQIPNDIYEDDSEDYLSETESLHSILTNAYIHLEASVVCKVSSTAKNMKAKLMEELNYEIKYLQSITLKKTNVESTDVTELPSIEVVEEPSSITENTDKHAATDDIKANTDVTVDYNEAEHHQNNVHQQNTELSDNANQIELLTVSLSTEIHGHDDTITTVNNVTPEHVTPAITIDEETIDCAITRYDEATTEITEQICTATEASTDCTEQFNITLPVADAPICDHDHTTELLPQATDTDPAAIHSQSTMLQNPESNSTSQIRMDSDTEEQTDDRKFCFQQYDSDDINKTWRSTSIVQCCCHSDYSCDILFLLLYS